MLKTLGKRLMNNIGLKLLALFFAVGLWMAVVIQLHFLIQQQEVYGRIFQHQTFLLLQICKR